MIYIKRRTRYSAADTYIYYGFFFRLVAFRKQCKYIFIIEQIRTNLINYPTTPVDIEECAVKI